MSNISATKREDVEIRKILFSLSSSLLHTNTHSNRSICLFSWFLSPLHNQAWFPPNRKTSLFPPCLRLSAILCGPGLSLWPKISPHGSSEWDRPHRPQAHSPKNTEQLSHSSPHSFISTEQTQELTEGKQWPMGQLCTRGDATLGVEKEKKKRFYYETTSDLINAQEKAAIHLPNECNNKCQPSDFSLGTKTSSGWDWKSSIGGGVGEIH